jgi:tetratricopeptide (TPR) repeat protein
MTRVERGPGIWLFGPAADMLWGAGLAYVVVFSILMVSGGLLMSVLPTWFMMFLVVLVSVPHYGATLLRAYEKEEDRRLYRLFSIYLTGALVLFFLWGIRDIGVGSILFTLYVTWSPWHYTAQNYGVALTFLGRRGIEVDPRTKRLLRLSVLLTFWISFLYMHGHSGYSPYLGIHVQFLSLDLPALPADVVMFASLLLYAVTTCLVVVALAGKGLRSSAPALGVLLTQFVWFVLPSVIKNWLPYGGPPIFGAGYDQYAFTWIALGHAVQYLWITAYFARATGQVSSPASFYRRAVVCGCCLWALPLFLFAPGLLGSLPFDGGLASVTAAVVNLHHFLLDGVIWKLRQPRVGGVLLSPNRASADPATRAALPLARPLVAAGLVSLAVLLFGLAEEEFGLARRLNRGDIAGAESSLDRLAWIGRDSARTRAQLGARRMKEGDPKAAERQLEIGVRVFPTASSWIHLGEARASQGKSRGSMEAYGEALVLEPGNVIAKLLLGLAHADLGETSAAGALLKQCDARDADTPTMRGLRDRLEGVLGAPHVFRSGA